MKRCQIDVRRNPKRLCKHEIKLPTSKGIFGTFPEEMCQVVYLFGLIGTEKKLKNYFSRIIIPINVS